MLIARTTYFEDTPVETADLLLNSQRYELEYAISVTPLS
jgi:hypothetical protein